MNYKQLRELPDGTLITLSDYYRLDYDVCRVLETFHRQSDLVPIRTYTKVNRKPLEFDASNPIRIHFGTRITFEFPVQDTFELDTIYNYENGVVWRTGDSLFYTTYMLYQMDRQTRALIGQVPCSLYDKFTQSMCAEDFTDLWVSDTVDPSYILSLYPKNLILRGSPETMKRYMEYANSVPNVTTTLKGIPSRNVTFDQEFTYKLLQFLVGSKRPHEEMDYRRIEILSVDEHTILLTTILTQGKTLRDDAGNVYEVMEKLGQGTFGTVYKVRRGEFVCAAKWLGHSGLGDVEILEKLWRGPDHPGRKYIIRYYGKYQHPSGLTIVFQELCDKEIADEVRVSGFNPKWTTQLRLALAFLQERRITHGDIYSSNVMLKDGNIRLIDFGLARTMVSRDVDERDVDEMIKHLMSPKV